MSRCHDQLYVAGPLGKRIYDYVGSLSSEQVKSLPLTLGLGGMGSRSEVFNRDFGTAQN